MVMHKIRIHFFIAGLVLCSQPSVAGSPPDPKSAAAVIAADQSWGDAEKRGDADFVDKLLLPEYRSISADGKVVTRAMIVEHTRARGASSEYARKVDAWKAGHPEHPEVTIAGDIAILTWVADEPPNGRVGSCDIFVYRDGRWHGIYSQHTSATQ
jgi:hypothetical protein